MTVTKVTLCLLSLGCHFVVDSQANLQCSSGVSC